jgi:hypothetical protein
LALMRLTLSTLTAHPRLLAVRRIAARDVVPRMNIRHFGSSHQTV